MPRIKPKLTMSGLRLSEEELKAIGRAKANPPGSEKRQHRRVQVPDAFPLLMQLHQSSQSDTVCTLVAKDLSSQGVGFFHASYVHPGTPAKFIMKSRDGEPMALDGTICRCRHIAGRVHELGALFEEPIALETYVEVPPEQPAAAPPPLSDAEMKAIHEHIAQLATELKALADDGAALELITAKLVEVTAAMSPPRPEPAAQAVAEAKPGESKDDAKPPTEGEGEKPAEAKAVAGEPAPSAH